MEHVHDFYPWKKKMKKSKKAKEIEKFIEEQIEEYIRIHKEHEKNLNYIG